MKVILLLCFFIMLPVQSKEKLSIAFGDALAPWVIPKSDSGILIDIIKEAFKPLDYELNFIYYPYLRRVIAFKNDEVDVVCDINPKTIEGKNLKGHFSGEVYFYENYAFSLQENNYHFKHLSELSNYSLMSWQGAIMHLGGEYAEMATKNSNYIESHNQLTQLKMLFSKRVQVIQLDEKIFNYYRMQLLKEDNNLAITKVDKFPLFGRSPNGFLFKDKKIKDNFLEQLALMKQDGRYDSIFEKYAPNLE